MIATIGHRVHVGVGDRRDEVGGARAGGRHADADLAGGAGVALGRVAGALLVADQDVADLGGVHQRVVGRQDRAAGDAEDGVDADALEGADQALRAGDLDRPGGPYRRREVGRKGCWGLGRPASRLAVRPCRPSLSSPLSSAFRACGRALAARARVGPGDEKTPRSGGGHEG